MTSLRGAEKELFLVSCQDASAQARFLRMLLLLQTSIVGAVVEDEIPGCMLGP